MQCCTLQLPLQLLLTNGYSSDDILAPISAAHSSACGQAGIRHATYSRFNGFDMLQEVIYYQAATSELSYSLSLLLHSARYKSSPVWWDMVSLSC